MVAVVILTYNGKNFLERFLPSVLQYSQPHRVVVVDNASTDGTAAYMQTQFSQVEYLQLPENKGFAGGYNEALKQIQAEYYVLLNSDVEVTENWINPVIHLLSQSATAAACQPKIRSYAEPSKFEYAGAAGGYIDWLGYPFCRGRIFDTLETDEGQYDDNREIGWATGACLFIKAAAFHEMGGFDAHFFAHMEEIDLCWRLQKAGYTVHYCSESTVYHVGGGTLHKSNPRKTFLNYRNNLAMLYKNLPATSLLPIIFMRLVLDGVSGVQLFLQGKFADTWAIVKAHFSFYALLPKLPRSQGIHAVKTIYPRSIIWQYFLLKRKFYHQLPQTK